MASEEPVTVTLVSAMIGASHAELRGEAATAAADLGGRVDVLAAEQRAAAAEAKLGRQLATREHGVVESRIDALGVKLDTVAEGLAAVQRDDQVDGAAAAADQRWKKRFWGLAATLLPVGLFVADQLLRP